MDEVTTTGLQTSPAQSTLEQSNVWSPLCNVFEEPRLHAFVNRGSKKDPSLIRRFLSLPTQIASVTDWWDGLMVLVNLSILACAPPQPAALLLAPGGSFSNRFASGNYW